MNHLITPALVYRLMKQAELSDPGATPADDFARMAKETNIVDASKTTGERASDKDRKRDDPSWNAPINIDVNSMEDTKSAALSKEAVLGSLMMRGARAAGSRLASGASTALKATGGSVNNMVRGAAGITQGPIKLPQALGTAADTTVSLAGAANPNNSKIQNASLVFGGGNAARTIGTRLTRKGT